MLLLAACLVIYYTKEGKKPSGKNVCAIDPYRVDFYAMALSFN